MNKKLLITALILAATTASASSSNREEKATHGSALASTPVSQIIPDLPNILQKIMPGVVNISAQGEEIVPPYMLKNHQQKSNSELPPEAAIRQFESLGSGVIVDTEKGYVLTNNHVIHQAKIITVTLNDGRKFSAKLVGADPLSDIAVLQIKADKLTALTFGDSDKLQVGEFVAAIGTPFGLNQTVTSGIVSGLQRTKLGIEAYENFIQTNASINMGNSGGALINQKGELIGINTAILGPQINIGIGFAIPSNMAHSLMMQLIQYGSVQRGLLGVMVQDLTPDLADAFQSQGLSGGIVTLIVPGSPAAKAGIKVGDVIQQINGSLVKSGSDVHNMVGLLRPGNTVKLRLIRQNKPLEINLVTADPKQYEQNNLANNPFLYGTGLKDFDQLTPMHGRIRGVALIHVKQDSAAWRAGLRRGDIIMMANNTIITNLDELEAAAKKDKHQLLLNLYRGGNALFLVVK